VALNLRLFAAQTKLAPQPTDTITAGIESPGVELRLQAQKPLDFAGLHVGRFDSYLQSLIVLRPLRWRAIERRIKAAARHIEDAAQQAKGVLESHRFYERVALSTRSSAKLKNYLMV